MKFSIPSQRELATEIPVQLQKVRTPQYGRYLDAFVPGEVFVHPRGYTFTRAAMLDFARTFLQANPLYLNRPFAEAHGFSDVLASPQLIFNVVLSLGVQNDSEKAIANLGYYDAKFLRPVVSGDTLRAMTRVKGRKERGPGKPGVVHIETLGVNQRDEVVLQYERKIMVAPQDGRPPASPAPSGPAPHFPWVTGGAVDLGAHTSAPANVTSLTGPRTYAEDFDVGDILVHANGRTITDEHMALTYAVGNTHPLHFDRVYSASLSGAMSGEPIVYGGLVYAWLDGLASRDVSENALWELGFTEGYHTQPVVSGDTVAAISRVLAVDRAPGDLGERYGVVTFQLIGVKNVTAKSAVDTYGADLFVKENDKKELGKEKIALKIFEIERRLLIKRRPG